MNSVLESVNAGDSSAIASTSATPCLDSLPTDEFLKVVGMRVRSQRSAMSMSRKKLAEVSGVSERYLAQLESGQGNMSIALLRKVTAAINMSLAKLLSAETPELLDETTKPVTGHQDAVRAVDSPVQKNGFSRENDAGSKNRWPAGH